MIVNGKKLSVKALCISPYDRGITLGHGLFETILVNKGKAPLLAFHWQRLVASAALLDLKIPFTLTQLQSMIAELTADNPQDDPLGIRLTVTDGVSERGLLSDGKQPSTFFITCFKIPVVTHAVTAMIASTKRNQHSISSQVKSTSYLDNIVAKKEAESQGFDEAILLNTASNVAEGSTFNVFMVKNKTIYTPPIGDGALPGVLRHILLNELEIKPFSIIEASLTPSMLFDAEEIFISNALTGLRSIKQLNNYHLTTHYPIRLFLTQQLKNQFEFDI